MRPLQWILNTDRQHQADSRQFGILLTLMTAWILALVLAVSLDWPARSLSTAFVIIAVQALLITSRSSREQAVFLIVGALLFARALFDLQGILGDISAVAFGVLLLFIPIRLSVFVLEQDEVGRNTIFGALCAYVFLGLSFAVVYQVIARLSPEAIHTPAEGAPDFVTWVYFSFTTLTTLGYGDIVPRLYPARIVAILEALIGQIYLVVVVARLVGAQVGKREAP